MRQIFRPDSGQMQVNFSKKNQKNTLFPAGHFHEKLFTPET
jgi:hypothetical protein